MQSPCFKPRRHWVARLTRYRMLSKRKTGAKRSFFDHSRFYLLPKTTIRDFARRGMRFLSFLIVKTHIVRMAFGAPFFAQSSVLTQCYAFKLAKNLDAVLLFIVALKPDFLIVMRLCECLKKGRQEIQMETDRANNVRHRIKRRMRQ